MELDQNSVDTEQFEKGVDEVIDVEQDVEQYVEQEVEQDVEEEVEEQVNDGIEIDGEVYTLEELREFKQAGLRQADYTRKTQSLSQKERELQEANEFYSYFRQNPHLLEQLSQMEVDPNMKQQATQLDPAMQRVQELEMMMYEKELTSELDRLSNKYLDFNDVAVLEKATELGITDLEFVYKGMKKEESVDVEAIKQEAIEEAKALLAKEIQDNKGKTKTLVNTSSEKTTPKAIELTPKEKEIADGLGVSYEDYAKNK